jgi:hypothetical protein
MHGKPRVVLGGCPILGATAIAQIRFTIATRTIATPHVRLVMRHLIGERVKNGDMTTGFGIQPSHFHLKRWSVGLVVRFVVREEKVGMNHLMH